MEGYLGFIGIVILMVAVVLKGRKQRILWFLSAVALALYNILRKDLVNFFVNFWLIIVNIYFIIWKRD